MKYLILVFSFLISSGLLSNDIIQNDDKIKSHNKLSNHYYKKNSYDSAIIYIDSAWFMAELGGDKKELMNSLYKRGIVHFGCFSYIDAIESLKKSLVLAKEIDDKKMIVDIYGCLGNLYRKFKKYDQSIDCFLKAIQIGGLLEDKKNKLTLFTNLGTTYYKKGDYIEAGKYYDKAIKMSQMLKSLSFEGINLINIGNIYYKNGIKDIAIINYEKAFDIINKTKDTLGFTSVILNSTGFYYDVWEDQKEGFQFYSKIIELLRQKNAEYTMAVVMSKYAKQMKEVGSYDIAIPLLKESYDLAKKYNYTPYLSVNTLMLFEIYQEIGSKKEAKKYFNLYNNYNTQLLRNKRERQLAFIERKLQMDVEISNLNEEKQKKELETKILYIALVFSALIVLMLIFYYYKRIEFKRVKHQLEQEKMAKELDSKKRELSTTALHISQKNELLIGFKERFDKLIPFIENPILVPKLNKLSKIIDENISQDKDWDNFKFHFDQVHPEFFKRIRDQYINITQNELKHCAYIRINISIKEIARMLNISEKGVRSTHYRLKKKVALSADESLYAFIQNY